MTSRFTGKARRALNGALETAADLGHTYIGSEHLLLSLSLDEDSVASKLLSSHGGDAKEIRSAIIHLAGEGAFTHLTANDMTPRTRRIIEQSALMSARYGQSYIGTEHLLSALLGEEDCVAVRILSSMGVSVEDIRRDIKNLMDATPGRHEEDPPTVGGLTNNGRKRESKDKSGDLPIPHAPTLSKYGRDLTAMAAVGRLDPIIGRESETDRVIRILSRRQKNNPCLIGEPGVGKTAVVEGLAQRIHEGNVPDGIKEKLVVTLDLSGMIAGAKYRGEFEERLKHILEEAEKNPHLILFIDEIHTIIGAGAAEGAVDAANIIKPALARGELQVIGATTSEEYRKHIEKDAALARRFQSVTVGEPTAQEALRILEGLRHKYENHHHLKILPEALQAAVELSVRYIPDRFLPDKALDLIDEAAARLRIDGHTEPPDLKALEAELSLLSQEKEKAILSQDFETAARMRDQERSKRDILEQSKSVWEQQKDAMLPTLTADHIAAEVTEWTGIPVSQLLDGEKEKLLHLEEILASHVIGQETAVSAVARAVRRGRIGLRDPRRPMGSFIFLGQTGVGKTELSVALATAMFGDKKALIRLDMSEYMEKHSVSKLIGAPPGYVGFEEAGQLTERVRRRPYAVVLFDEIEKAHPDVFNILLQVLDDGVLTDAQGRQVDFRNTIIIMTSNLGATAAGKKLLGFTNTSDTSEDGDTLSPEARRRMMTALKDTFRPEFINRVDDIVLFKPLGKEALRSITSLLLSKTMARVRDVGVELSLDDSVTELISQEGMDPAYGARPLRRAVVRLVEDALSEALLNGTVQKGVPITATAENGQVVFRSSSEETITP
ncbi:MAG: ATP-dependent Clp protease ATP-binding subunit [Ruminococcaceae bacterium]|nr:ATP-dependent Clp protease ATP-binding subunit [Oscillospiraceae bacterium]